VVCQFEGDRAERVAEVSGRDENGDEGSLQGHHEEDKVI